MTVPKHYILIKKKKGIKSSKNKITFINYKGYPEKFRNSVTFQDHVS